MIEWKDVSFTYPGQESDGLQQVNLSISAGECVLFCGRSGCGKTTMLRLVNGLIPNFFPGEGDGAAYLQGQDCSEIPMYRLAERVGSVFQNPRTQFFNVDTDSEIAFGMENQALPPTELARRVEQTARELNIETLRGRSIFALSGGEKQKIAFSSVYAMNPDIYLLDEPSSNLDMDSIRALKEYLKLIKAQGKTILIAEHRLYYLMELVDKIVYLERGRIKGIYTPKELAALSQEQRASMGLRAVNLQQLRPQKRAESAQVPILALKNVRLCYQKKVVLENICLQAARGEIIAVVGHNGTGKTTFSRALCGLHKGCEGEFLWGGKSLSAKTRRKRSYLVMQDVGYQLFAESVEKECVFGIKNPNAALADRTLEDLGLSSFREKHPNTLSGGQKQRLAVAVSMVCGKDILVFDEPTSGLDHDSMTQVAALMERLAEQGGILFVVTHDYELVCRVCTRVVHFDEGEMPDDLPVTVENERKIRELFHLQP
jgi:ATPase components of various ABC-type transport systems, contain duplicated ATPase